MSHIEIKRGSSMAQGKQSQIAELAASVCGSTSDPTRIASTLKQRLDERWPRHWHVTVGRDFVNCVEHIENDEIMFYYGHLCIQAWRCGPPLPKQ